MIKQWRERVGRIASMSQHERFDRLRQQTCARVDDLRHRAGLDFSVDLRAPGTAPPARFFFSPQDVPALCSLLKQRLPQQAEEISRRAEKICRHRFDLLGYDDVDHGDAIDWHCDRVHGKRAPRKPWFKIRYLDFAQAGDVKVTWELNRHQHLIMLAKAYRLTNEQRFADELFRQWRHWQAENPYPVGVNWASSLEVAIRSLSWIWVYFLLADSPAMPAGFREEWLGMQGISGRHIARYLSTYFSPNTHLLGEAVALFFIGTACPDLAEAKRWQQQGWDLVLREAQRQARRDGLHFEQSVYYHVYALDLLLHAAVLAGAAGLPIPSQFERTLENMLAALALLCRAGPPPQLGDDDGGRVFDPRRNRGEHMLDPLATAAVLYQRGDFKSLAGDLREETLWLLGAQGVAEFDRIATRPADASSAILESSGLYLMASAASREQIMIDAGPQGAGTAGHGHADALSLCWSRAGRPLLIDPGTFEYVGCGPERKQFRSTGAHNTLLVDGLSQATPKGPFGWARLPRVQAEGWVSGQNFDLFVGSHDGYCRLPSPVVHRRWVFWLKPHFWLVRDLALGEGQHRLDILWHLSPQLSPRDDAFVDGEGRGLRLLTVEGHGWSQEVQAGWWSPVYGRKEPAPVLRFSAAATLPAEFVTLAQPVTASTKMEGHLSRLTESSSTVSGFRYHAAEEEHCIIFARPSQVWTLGPWSSDAEFLYWGKDSQRRLLVCCNLTHLEAGGKRVLTSRKPVLRCEMVAAAEQVQVTASSDDVLVNRNALPSEFKPAMTGASLDHL